MMIMACHVCVVLGDVSLLCVCNSELGMDESLFRRLDNGGATYQLNLQYRMNRY